MKFDLSTAIEFLLHGTFEAPDSKWVHMSRSMECYELFYVTSGILYISDDQKQYVVNAGSFDSTSITTEVRTKSDSSGVSPEAIVP